MTEEDKDWPAEIDAIEVKLKLAKVTQRRLCESAGVHQSTWNRWKFGATKPTARTWRDIEAALLELKVEELAVAAAEGVANGRAA